MFFSNLDNPLVTTTGTFPDAAIAIKDIIVGAVDSPWAEVTNAAPTPAFLQPYASTVTAAGDQTVGFDRHVTLYLKNDPGLLAAEPHARMWRIVMYRYALMSQIIDTKFADASIVNQWCNLATTPSIEYSNFYYDQQASYGTLFNTLGSETTNIGVGKNIHTTILMWEDMLYIKSVKTSTGQEIGGVMLFYPNTIPGNQQTVETMPMIWAMPTTYSYTSEVWTNGGLPDGIFNARASPTLAPTMNTDNVYGSRFESYVLELGFIPGNGDKDDREYLQRIALASGQAGVTHWAGLNSHIRVSRSALAQGFRDRKIIDGIEYLEIKNYGGRVWYLRLADNNNL